MLNKKLLEILICPASQTSLSLANEELLDKLNRAIRAGKISNKVGDLVQDSLQGGLVPETGSLLYPLVDDIPVLLVDESIALDQIEDAN